MAEANEHKKACISCKKMVSKADFIRTRVYRNVQCDDVCHARCALCSECRSKAVFAHDYSLSLYVIMHLGHSLEQARRNQDHPFIFAEWQVDEKKQKTEGYFPEQVRINQLPEDDLRQILKEVVVGIKCDGISKEKLLELRLADFRSKFVERFYEFFSEEYCVESVLAKLETLVNEALDEAAKVRGSVVFQKGFVFYRNFIGMKKCRLGYVLVEDYMQRSINKLLSCVAETRKNVEESVKSIVRGRIENRKAMRYIWKRGLEDADILPEFCQDEN